MKKIRYLSVLALLLCQFSLQAQTMDDKGRIRLGVWVPESVEGLTPIIASNLENKLIQIAADNGLIVIGSNSRFIITGNISTMSKDITPTAPPMHSYTLNLVLYIGDGIDGTAFSSYSTTLKGVGETPEKAYLAAIKNLKTKNPAYQTFIDQGKSKIIAYYNAQCDYIIKGAQVLASTNQFDEALWNLAMIPDVCPECWKKAQDAALPIFKTKINFECRVKMNEATNIWNAGQSWDAANRAGAILSTIDPNSDCYKDIPILAEKIQKRIKEVDQREWNFIWEREINLTRDWIKAWRDVGVAWGLGQPRTIIYKSLW
jgi:hypothetical protein